jgi:RimJ/RimL family protein N-acetyltransferase
VYKFGPLAIRGIEDEDLLHLQQLRALVWRNLGTIAITNLDQQRRWLQSVSADPHRAYYVLHTEYGIGKNFIGIVRTDEIDMVNRSMRVGGDILPTFQNQGYGQQMFELIKTFSFDYLNMHRIWLLVMETNERAIHVYRKAGFRDEGRQREAVYRDGRYLDYLMMSMLREEFDAQRG